MRYYHSIFKQLHFDYGRMLWSVNHMPVFGALLSVCDHRGLGSMHSISFYAFLKVLTDGKITRKQADAIFSLLDISSTGEISFSEISFWAGILVAQKDHLEREFLYMHAWKVWVTFNEKGSDQVITSELRRTGLFFDFDYPTIYYMFRDYNWDDDRPLEFERFRFFLVSCIHFRTLRRANSKYLRYKKFKLELLEVLRRALTKVLRENLYPAPTVILRAIRSIKIPPIEGQEKIYHWSDVITLHWARNYVNQQWEIAKMRLLILMHSSVSWKWVCECFCCGLCCIRTDTDSEVEKIERQIGDYTRYAWNACCICCCFFGCCGTCLCRKNEDVTNATPMKPVIIRRGIDAKKLIEIEKKQRHHKIELVDVQFENDADAWKSLGKRKQCAIQ